MKIFKSYKTELKPTKEQIVLLNKSVGVARFAYNWGLNKRKELWESERKTANNRIQWKELCSIKKNEFPWMYEVSKCCAQSALEDVDRSYQNFFRGLKKGQHFGFPKFKSKRNEKQSFRITSSLNVYFDRIHIAKIGKVKLKQHSYIPIEDTRYISFTISKRANRWFISVQVEEEIDEPKQPESILGIDVGISKLATCSNGQTFENNKYLYKSENKLKRAQRALSRKKYISKEKRWSNNGYKQKIKVQKIYFRISNQRNDQIHKMTSELVKTKPRYIVVENLKVSKMMKNHKLSKSIGDSSFYEIKRQIKYKCNWYGGMVIEADQFFPSSKTCSSCGSINKELTLADRIYTCDCGLEIDRDLNAAINLERYGMNIINNTGGHSEIQACGESIRLLNLKGFKSNFDEAGMYGKFMNNELFAQSREIQ